METGGNFTPRIQDCYEGRQELRSVAFTLEQWRGIPLADVLPSSFRKSSPQPRQVFANGLNYAAEAALAVPDDTLAALRCDLTGTPAGVGVGRTPRRFLRPGPCWSPG